MMNVGGAGTSSAMRRSQRRLRAILRHEQQTVAMELAAALHHSRDAGPGTYAGLRAQKTASSGRPPPGRGGSGAFLEPTLGLRGAENCGDSAFAVYQYRRRLLLLWRRGLHLVVDVPVVQLLSGGWPPWSWLCLSGFAPDREARGQPRVTVAGGSGVP